MSKHKSRPWNLELFRGFDENFSEDQLLINNPIREFLDSEDKFILVGAKGLGKTLFLRYKSYLYHQEYGESIQFNESQTELTENLNIHADTFSKEELLRFRDESLWILIWELALWTMLFRVIKAPINPNLDKLIESSEDISSILTHLLNHRQRIDQYRAYVTEFQGRKRLIKSGVALFIDDVDQTLQALLASPHASDTYQHGRQNPSVEVWVYAQMGLVNAIYNLNRQNAHIKIYATIRREAFEAYESEIKINLRKHISRLEYNKSEIWQIFQKNIEMTEPSQIFKPDGNTPVERFVGYNTLPHRFANDPSGRRREEDVLKFIYRHTYGRPREIVFMGQEINELVSSHTYREAGETERHELLRVVVNRVSNELFQQYKKEVIPYWDDVKMTQFVEALRSNVIPREDFRLYDAELLQQYYNLGLLGYVRPTNHAGELKQVFETPATYNYRNMQALPNTDFLLVHSTMDQSLVRQHTYGNFYNPYNIIGDGYDFYPRIDNPIRPPEFYLPRDISGNRMRAPNETAGHVFPLEEMYHNFFTFDNAVSRFERFQMHMTSADQVLGLLGRICYCHLLEKQFQTGYYAAKEADSRAELARHNYVRPYNAEIPDAFSDPAFNRFLDKLYGRYITLGAYLVLDLRVEWMHTLLTRGQFDFGKTIVNKDTAFTYLSRSFFIRELKKEEPRDPDNPTHRQLKQHIFNYLSDFEQETLRNFVRNASDEVHYLSWLEAPEHKHWLCERVLNPMWRPE